MTLLASNLPLRPHIKLQDGVRRPSVDLDAFATSYLNQGVTLTFGF